MWRVRRDDSREEVERRSAWEGCAVERCREKKRREVSSSGAKSMRAMREPRYSQEAISLVSAR